MERALEKIDRANEHAHLIDQEIRTWFQEYPYTISEKVNSDFTRHSLILSVGTPPPLRRWSLIFGDAVHNLRCALDHLVYAISVHELKSDPPPNQGITQFVINDRGNDFKSKFWRIKDLSDSVRKAIEGVQPYNRPHAFLPPALALIRDLDDSDKHRLIRVAVHKPISFDVSLTGFGFDVSDLTFENPIVELVDGAELAWITSKRPTPYAKLEASVTLSVVVTHDTGPTGIYATGIERLLINELIPEVREVVQIVADAVP
jgi:hypothetical protein